MMRGQAILLSCLLLGLLALPAAASPPPQLEAVELHYEANTVLIDLRFANAPAPEPIRHFSFVMPHRLVVDLPLASLASGVARKMAGSGLLRQVALAADDQRLRLLADLKQDASYRWHIQNQTLRIALQERSHDAEAGNVRIDTIDFQRGASGEGRLALEMNDMQAVLNVRQLGQKIVVDIPGAHLPASLQRTTEVGHFATPVLRYLAMHHETGTRLVIEPQGLWRYNAYQTGKRLLIDVFPAASQPHRLTPDGNYRGDKLSLHFQNIEVRAALQVLADFTGLNIVASDAVAGELSLRLKDVPWDQALDLILQACGLEIRRQGDIIWVAPREEILAREKLELQQKATIAELEPLHAETFQLNYQRADTFRRAFGIGDDGAALAERRNALLSRRGSAIVDARTNQLFVTDTLAVLANIRKLLERIDVPARQVLIEARIVEADDSFGRNLGIKLGFSIATRGAAVGNTYGTLGEPGDKQAQQPTTPLQDAALDLRAQNISGTSPGSFAFTLFNAAAHRFLNLELSALESEGRGQIVSSPRVITADQQAALIEQGEEIPYQQTTHAGATATSFKKANLKLEVTPQITPDGNVILDVDVNKDSRGSSTPAGLAINTKHVKTKVQVEDGGTVVIGGIYTQTDHQGESRVPVLGEIPLLGHLFKQSARLRDKTELLIFLTPRIVAIPRPY